MFLASSFIVIKPTSKSRTENIIRSSARQNLVLAGLSDSGQSFFLTHFLLNIEAIILEF